MGICENSVISGQFQLGEVHDSGYSEHETWESAYVFVTEIVISSEISFESVVRITIFSEDVASESQPHFVEFIGEFNLSEKVLFFSEDVVSEVIMESDVSSFV